MSALIQTIDLHRTFTVNSGMFKPRQTLHAVNGINLTVERGDVMGIVGESGCGKSTLARMLLGLTPPSQGQILIDGQDVGKMDRRELARRVQPVFQDPYSSLNPRRSIASIVSFPLDVHGIGSPQDRRNKAIEMLERVGLPARYADNTPGQLSGGQRQLIGLTRLLLADAPVWLLDEPTASLDIGTESLVLKTLQQRGEGRTLVIVTHKQSLLPLFDRLIVVTQGRVVLDGPRDAVLARLQATKTDTASTHVKKVSG